MDIHKYRDELVNKLAKVDEVIAGMIGRYAPKTGKALLALAPSTLIKKRRKMSAAVRAKMSAAAKARWVKIKAKK